jgi:hypothetical protein
MFKYFFNLKKRKKLLQDMQPDIVVENEFARVKQEMGIVMATPQFQVLVEYLEAKIEAQRDILELSTDTATQIRSQARLAVYRDLIALFQNYKELEDITLLQSTTSPAEVG